MTASLGIDIGGTGIKGAPVDLIRGRLLDERCRLLTPHPATPEAVSKVVGHVVEHFAWRDTIGCTFPAIVRKGVTLTATNVDAAWIGTDAARVLGAAAGHAVTVINDADAAGLAETRFGAARGNPGVVLMLTFGTGIGSALFIDGHLVPNMQLGHLEVDGKNGELRASDAVRQKQDLSWKRWAKRVNRYLEEVETVCVPELIVIGGGVSKNADEFLPRLKARARIVAAALGNDAGIIGAAMTGAMAISSIRRRAARQVRSSAAAGIAQR